MLVGRRDEQVRAKEGTDVRYGDPVVEIEVEKA